MVMCIARAPALPVHDSYVIEEEYVDECWAVMKKAFTNRFDQEIPIDITDIAKLKFDSLPISVIISIYVARQLKQNVLKKYYSSSTELIFTIRKPYRHVLYYVFLCPQPS